MSPPLFSGGYLQKTQVELSRQEIMNELNRPGIGRTMLFEGETLGHQYLITAVYGSIAVVGLTFVASQFLSVPVTVVVSALIFKNYF